MSLRYSYVPQKPVKLSEQSFAPIRTFGKRHMWSPARIIAWDRKSWAKLRDSINILYDLDPKDWKDLSLEHLEEPLRSSLHSFLVNLSCYSEFADERIRILDPLYILIRSINEGPSFAEWLDGFRTYFITRKTRRLYLDTTELDPYFGFADLIDQVLNEDFCVGSIFRPDSLFPWQPPETLLSEYSFESVDQDEQTLLYFKDSCKEILKDVPISLTDVQLKEIIRDSATSCLEGPTWKVDYSPPAKKREKSKLIQVPANLKKCRPACVESYASALKIRWIDSAVRKINLLNKKAGISYSSDEMENLLRRQIRKFGNIVPNYHSLRRELKKENARTSYCRDFKKEGITKPRNLLNIMLKEINEKFPSWESIKETNFFDDWPVEVNGEIVHPLRGHGLGMANELTTFMQIAIEGVNIKRGAPKPRFSCYLNDDAVVIFNNWKQAAQYQSIDKDTCEKLGLSFKKKGTFLCIGHAVFCEIYCSAYLPVINNKDVFDMEAYYNIFKLTNSLQLADLLRSQDELPPDFVLDRIKNYYKELSVDIFSVPEILGGLQIKRLFGIDCSNVNRRGILTRDEYSIYTLQKMHLVPVPWKKMVKKSKSLMFYKKDFLKLMSQSIYNSEHSMFRPSFNPKESQEYWLRVEKTLSQISNAFGESENVTWDTVLKEIIEQNPDTDFINQLGVETDKFEYYTKDSGLYNNPYRYSMKIADYLYKNKGYKYIRSEKNEHFSLNEKDRILMESRYKKRKYHGNPIIYSKISNPPEESFNVYHDPFCVKMACDACDIPLTLYEIPEKKKLLLNLREEIYGPIRGLDWIRLGCLPEELRWLYPKVDLDTIENLCKLNYKRLKPSLFIEETDFTDEVSLLKKLLLSAQSEINLREANEKSDSSDEESDKAFDLGVKTPESISEFPEETILGKRAFDEAFIEELEDDAFDEVFGDDIEEDDAELVDENPTSPEQDIFDF